MNELKTETAVKILLVDDEENILRALKRLLVDEDYQVMTAGSGEKALEILRENRDVGLIVSDQRMPGLSGVEFLERAREIAPDAMRIMLTGYADINAAIDAINRGGAYRYISKPWNDDELLQLIRDAVQRYSLVRENRRLSEIIKRQNEELKNWNAQLEYFVQEQTVDIQKKNEELERLNRRLKENFKNTIIAFSGLLELRDKGNGNHARYVAELSSRVAREMGLPAGEVEAITVASLLHDIGKIGISDLLLLKEMDDMDPEELKEYMTHPVRGQTAIDSIEDLREAGILIRHHHESYNGTGFPDGLSGTDIPLGSRIIAVADFVDRRIRRLKTLDAVKLTLKKVNEGLGRRFDPKLYRPFEMHVHEVYRKLLSGSDMVEVEVYPEDLRTGMVLSRDVTSGTGLLVLGKGVTLNEKNIKALRRFYQLDPSRTGVFVWVKR